MTKKITHLPFSLRMLLWCMLTALGARAQTTIATTPTFTNNNGSGLVTFNFENSNSFPIVITDISSVFRVSGSATFTLYYNTTPISAPPGIIPTSSNWTVAATNVVNSSIGSTSNQTLEPVLNKVGLIIPANTTYGLAVSGFLTNTNTGVMSYYTMPATPPSVTFSGGGGTIRTGAGISYGTTSPTAAASNTPRGFVGSLTFESVTGPNDAGIDSLISPATSVQFCSGLQDVTVRLKNAGNNPITEVNIHWSIDGVMQKQMIYNSKPLAVGNGPDSRAAINLGSVAFDYGIGKTIKAWSANPNGKVDTFPKNDTLTITIKSQRQGIDIQLDSNEITICDGDSVLLDAGAFPNTPLYIWNNGKMTQQIMVNKAGKYIIRAQNNVGCVDVDSVTVLTAPLPKIMGIGIIENSDGGFSFNAIRAQNVATYTWDFGDGTRIEGLGAPAEQTHSFTAPGEQEVSLSVYNDCGAATVTRWITTGSTGMGSMEKTTQGVQYYPNPAKDKLFVTATNQININTIYIYNLLGQCVYKHATSGIQNKEINVKDFPEGIYVLKIKTDNIWITKSFEVIR